MRFRIYLQEAIDSNFSFIMASLVPHALRVRGVLLRSIMKRFLNSIYLTQILDLKFPPQVLTALMVFQLNWIQLHRTFNAFQECLTAKQVYQLHDVRWEEGYISATFHSSLYPTWHF